MTTVGHVVGSIELSRALRPILALAIVIAVILGSLCLFGTGMSSHGRYVALGDGRRLFLDCRGRGSPTVLLEGGYAASSQAWFKVQPVIARVTHVCSYDRAGYGRSDPGPFPRDGLAVARDLDEALRRAQERGPFVVVGHSAGALYVRIFADLRPPRDVVGMVLVDPSVEYQDERFSSRFGPGFGSVEPLRDRDERCLEAAEAGVLPSSTAELQGCTPQRPSGQGDNPDFTSSLRPASWRTRVSELDTLWIATSDEVARGRHSYGSMPLVVLTAGKTYAATSRPLDRALQSFWTQLHQDLARRSRRGREETVPRASHLMMLDQPAAIVSAIEAVVNQARRDGE
jgi:pimeloyl-ACP methyl ester carboxylesterase